MDSYLLLLLFLMLLLLLFLLVFQNTSTVNSKSLFLFFMETERNYFTYTLKLPIKQVKAFSQQWTVCKYHGLGYDFKTILTHY